MKKNLFLLTMLLAVLMPSAFAQITDYVVIGTKTQSSSTAPFNQSYKYSYSECIYPKSSFSGPVTIYSLSYNCAKVKALTITDFKIYLGVTSKSSNGSNNWTPEQELTLVYDHANVVVGESTGWQEIMLDTPFLYDATQNLVVVIAKKGKVSNSTLTYYFSNTTNSIMYRQSKTDESFANHPGTTASTSTTNFRANIKIGVGPYLAGCDKPTDLAQVGATAHSVTINWKPAEDTDSWDVYIGETPDENTEPTATVNDTTYTFTSLVPAEEYYCYVRTSCGETDKSEWVPVQTMTDPDFTGEGTADAPYLIYTLDNINTIIYAMEHNWSTYGKYFRLMDDIATLTRPIGTDNVLFRGDFDGNGHFITLDLNGSQFQALFARLGIGANVHDVNVDGTITATSTYAGGICAIISEAGGHSTENIYIRNCTNYATINGSSRAGGIIGMSNLSTQSQYTKLYVENCVNRGVINCTEGFIGGIAGVLANNAILDGCYNRANVAGNSTIGGIFGEIDGSTARNCYNKADITSYGLTTPESIIGGIGGSLYNSSLYNCYSIGDITGIYGVGGLLGEFMNAVTTGTYYVKNVYVSGNVIASPDTNRKGFIFGDIVTDNPENFIVDNAFYESNGQSLNPWGGNKTPSATNVCSYSQSTSNPTEFILSQAAGGSTDLLSVLNTWAAGGEEYTSWYADIYSVNADHPTLGEVEEPGISITPKKLDFFYRPIGAKMFSESLSLTNDSDIPLTITDISFDEDNTFFMFEGEEPEIPFTIQPGITNKINITTDPEAAVTPGAFLTKLGITYSSRSYKEAYINAIAYQPVEPDVVELHTVISSYPFNITQSTLPLNKNYNLHSEETSGPDGVYKMTFDTDVALTATLTGCNNPAMAIYKEDFNGKDYPDVDNFIYSGRGDITDVTMPAGTYYIVASATSSQYILDVNTETIPLPLEPTAVSPADGQTNLEGTVQLVFGKGNYATEYQILCGTTNPPTEVVMDWTNDFGAVATVDVDINSVYYWRVNQRNSSGVTEGPVWRFTSVFTKPGALFCDTKYIYEGQTAQMHWTAPANGNFLGYNIYQDGVKVNSSTITGLTYEVSGLTYNMDQGYTFTVTAVYDGGESLPSTGDFVRVTGNGTVAGHVYEIDGTTPIANATVTLTGIDEIHNNQTYTFNTNGNGEFSHPAVAGNYTATAVKDDYMVGTHIGVINVSYSQTTNFNVSLRESVNPVADVSALFYNNRAQISWTWEGTRSFQYFNVYRKNCLYPGEPVLVATNVNTLTYNDYTFTDLPWGSYTYGVSAYYDGIHESGIKWEDKGVTAYAITVGNGSTIPFTYGSFDIDAPQMLTQIAQTTDMMCGTYGGNGCFYAYDSYMYFYKYDVATGTMLDRIYTGCYFTDMTYDHTTNTVYATHEGILYTINTETGEPTMVSSLTDYRYMQVIACDANGQLYGIEPNEDGVLYRINKMTGDLELVGNTGTECLFLQSGDFDKENGVFYWMGCNGNGGFLATVNTETGHATIYATGLDERISFFIPYDEPNPVIHESEIVWSNCLDNDMEVTMTVNVTTNNEETPEGTTVDFVSTTEPGITFEATLNEDGTVTWDNFRKGSYLYSIKKTGFNSCAFKTPIDVSDDMTVNCELEEATAPVENLHVSHTGWMSWDNPNEHQYLEGDEFHFDFEDGGIDGFTLLDVDGDGFNWTNSKSLNLNNGHDSHYCITSQSYDNEIGPLHPNNYIITAQKYLIGTTSQLSWYVCAQDQYYADEHYSVMVATAEYPSPDDFVAVYEETITSKSGKGERNDKAQGIWHNRVADLAQYSGEEVWIAIRHHNSTDNYMIDIDDFTLYNRRNERFILEGFEVYQDGYFVATTTDNYFQLDVEGLTEGESYNASVVAVYQTGDSNPANFIWKYNECDNYEGVGTFNGMVEGGNVILTWDGVPDGEKNREGQWFFYDNGQCDGALEGGERFFWGIEIPREDLSQYTDYMLTKVSMFDAVPQEGVIMIYQGGETSPDELIYEQVYQCKGTGVYTDFMLHDPVALDIEKNLWIVMHPTSGVMAAPAMGGWHTWRGSMVSFDGESWQDMSNLGYFVTWNLRAYIEENTWSLETRAIALFRDEICITPDFLDPSTTSFVDIAPEEGLHTYSIRVVKGEPLHHYNWNSMSCPQSVELLVDPDDVEENNINGVTIYPNPTNGIVNIKGESINSITIYNSLGQVIYVSDIENDMFEINMKQFGTGMYMVKLISETGNSTRKVNVF